MIGAAVGMTVGLCSQKLQCKMKMWCNHSRNQMDKAYHQLNRAGVYLQDINSNKVRKEFDCQINKLKRMYHDLMNADLKDEMKNMMQDFLQSVQDVLEDLRDALRGEDLETSS